MRPLIYPRIRSGDRMPLKLSLSSTDPLSVAADVAVIGVPEGASHSEGVLGALASALGRTFEKAVKRDEFTGKKDQVLDLSTSGALPADRVIVIGMGKASPL